VSAPGTSDTTGANVRAVHRISVPLARNAAVNVWLLRADPLTLIDTGPVSAEALAALEDGLARAGTRIEELERVLLTHHHADHVGLAETVRRRSGAEVAALADVAAYLERFGERVAAEKAFARELLGSHGVPGRLCGDDVGYWRWLDASFEDCTADRRLAEGDVVRAGGRDLRVVHRPGHTETDTLFVDDATGIAFVGDHLLAEPAYAEIGPAPDGARTRPLARYLENLRRLAADELGSLHPGHGPDVLDHRRAVGNRLAAATRRCARIIDVLGGASLTAFEVAEALWSPARVAWDPMLAVSDAIGHLDLLVDDGSLVEVSGADGTSRYVSF
jgi:glyoxylase-like metal-dependent hydrolase (beta-lactamase superfamily II)